MPNTGDIVRASDFEAVKPQLSIGTVTTGAAGSNASASITGTSPNFKLNLTIPRGNTGATGATGPQGPSGTYTGPLKPTSSYWQVTKRSLPSGGTWAYWQFGYDSDNRFLHHDIYSGIKAGGTVVGSYSAILLCWRIQ